MSNVPQRKKTKVETKAEPESTERALRGPPKRLIEEDPTPRASPRKKPKLDAAAVANAAAVATKAGK